MIKMKEAVFLDCDGVINKSFVKDSLSLLTNLLDELKILPGVKESQFCYRYIT